MVVFRTIRSKIIVGIVTLLLVMALALTLVATQRTEAALRDQVETTHDAHAQRIAQQLDQRLLVAVRAVETAAQDPAFDEPIADDDREANGHVGDNGTRQRAVLQQVVAATDLLEAAWLIGGGGDLVLGAPPVAEQDLAESTDADPVRLRVYVEIAEQTRATTFQRGANPGTWLILTPLVSHDGILHGVLLFAGQSAPLVSFAERAVEGDDTLLLILDDAGQVVAGPAPFAPGYDASGPTARLGVGSGEAQEVQLAGTRYLASSFAVPSGPWRLVLLTESDAAFAVVDTIIRTTVLLGAIALVFGIAMSLILAQDLSVPVNRLKDAAERVTAGEYGTQVRVSTGDELADLAGAFNAMSARLRDENQRLLRYQESLEETVTERTQALREKNEELEAFVYAASHDLRTPIISLDWLLQELEERIAGNDDPETHETLARLRANVDGMDRLINELLELSRIGRAEGEPEPVPIGPAVQEVREALQAHIDEHGTRIDVDVPADAVVLADRRRIQQVFANMLGNAIKYGRDSGGQIVVRAIPVGSAGRPWKWRIEIQDNGPGVRPEDRERIFMLFQRAPDALGRPIQGTGVGLALVRKIVLSYGGQVHVTDAPGGGALFWFTLPAPRPPRADAPDPAATPAEDPTGTTETP